MKKTLLCGAIACAFTPAFAEDVSTFDLGTIVVTPARAPQPLAEAVSSTTVITREEIIRAGQQSLVELLQAQGGVEIATNGGPGQLASVFIRGAESRHTLVLVDGVRMENVTSGTTALEHIPLAQIERIEILRGPGASLYGADAIGGVVQIFTRREKGAGFDATLGAGSDQAARAGLGAWQRWGATQVNVRVGHTTVDAPSASNARAGAFIFNPDRDPYRSTSLSLSLDHDWDGGNRAGVSFFAAQGNVHFDAGAGSDPVKKERLQTVAAYSRNRLGSGWESLVRIAQAVDDYRFVNVPYAAVKSIQDQFTWQNDWRLATGQTLTAGLEYTASRIDTSTAYDRTRRHVASAFAIYRLQKGPQDLQLSLRHDDNSQFGGHTTGGIGYGLRLSPDWRASANLATAFRAPSFMDLYYPGFANPDLKPERSLGGEVSLHYGQAGPSVRLTAFANRLRDLIAFDWGASKPTCPWGCPVNVGRANTQGVEVAARLPLSGNLRLTAQGTVQKTEDADTGRRLPRRAEYFGSLGLLWQQAAWELSGELVGSGDRFDSRNEAPSSRLPAYGVMNLQAAYRLERDLTLALRWNNVFDRQYELAKGYPAPGASAFVELRYTPR